MNMSFTLKSTTQGGQVKLHVYMLDTLSVLQDPINLGLSSTTSTVFAAGLDVGYYDTCYLHQSYFFLLFYLSNRYLDMTAILLTWLSNLIDHSSEGVKILSF